MSDVILRSELKRLLRNPPFGGPAALAQAMQVKDASVSAWRRGHSVPRASRWPDLEDYLSLPRGHLERAYHGDVDADVQAVWPELRSSEGDDGRVKPMRKPNGPTDEVNSLRAETEALRQAVRALFRLTDAPPDVVALLDASPVDQASDSTEQSAT